MWGLIYLRDVWFAYTDIDRTARDLGDPYLVRAKIQSFVEEFRYLSWWLIGIATFIFELYLVTDFYGLRTNEDWLLMILIIIMVPIPYFLAKWLSRRIMSVQTQYFLQKYRIDGK